MFKLISNSHQKETMIIRVKSATFQHFFTFDQLILCFRASNCS